MRNEIQKLSLPLPLAIVGMGITGSAVLKLLLAAGLPRNQILTFDQKEAADFQNPQDLLDKKPQTLCVSPGISLQSPWIQSTVQKGIHLTSELEIAFSFLTTEKVVAITGSVGKSTVTALLGEAVLAEDPQAFVGGNLGIPLAQYATLRIKDESKKAQFVVLELSSYQLENFKNLRAQIGILTYLSPNHLERYCSLEQYYETKMSLFAHVSVAGIVNKRGGDITSYLDVLKKRNPSLNWVITDRSSLTVDDSSQLVGTHNQDNLSLAVAAAKELQLPTKSFTRMGQFQGLPHRMENCGAINGILFINDSKATSIDSVLQAYHSVASKQKGQLHLLLGGRDKNLPWDQLRSLKDKSHLSCHFFGEFGAGIKEKSQLQGPVFQSLKACLNELRSQLQSGDLVLLSPGGTSLDEFKNFEERGNFFKSWVSLEFKSRQN